MNKTQRIHAIKRILREEFSAIELERTLPLIDFLSTKKIPIATYRLRNSQRVDWATRIEAVLNED